MWIRSGPLAQRLALGFDNLVADVYWMRAVIYFGGQRRVDAATQFRPAVPAAGSGDVAGSALPCGVPLWRDLPGRSVPGRRRPARSGRATAAARASTMLPSDGSTSQDIGFVYYWWMRDYERAAEWFKQGRRHSGRADVAGAAGRHDAGGRRQPAVVAPAVDAAARHDRRGLDQAQRRAPVATARRDGLHRRAQSHHRATSPSGTAARRSRGRNWRSTSGGAAFRPIRPACRSRSIPRPGGSASGPSPGSSRCRTAPPPRPRVSRRNDAAFLRCSLPALLRRVHRQLPQRRDLPTAAGAVAGLAAVALPAVRLPVAVVRQHSDLRLAAARRPVPQVPQADLDSVPDRRADHRAVVRPGGVGHAARSAAGQPADPALSS